MRAKTVIGRREFVSLPDWGILNLHAKIDTGAQTSAIHVENLVEVGNNRIKFEIVLSRMHSHKRVTAEATVERQSHVKSSSGEQAERYFVKTRFNLGPVSRMIEISLVNRDNMTVRMLVGRSALGEDFLVDPHAAHLLGRLS